MVETAVRRVPGVLDGAWRRAGVRYVAGPDAASALAVAHRLDAIGIAASIDLFGERVADRRRVLAVVDDYLRLAATLVTAAPGGTWLSLDLSHVGFDVAGLRAIAAALPPDAMLQVGAEEAAVTDRVLAAVLEVAGEGLPVAATLQANLKRSPDDAQRLDAAGVPVRLVKGAYVEPASAAYAYGPDTDAAWLELATTLARPRLATHDAALRSLALERRGAETPCEVLLGIDPSGARQLAASGTPVMAYVPFGPDWLRYALRRRAEAQGTR